MTYYAKPCGEGIDLVDDDGIGICLAGEFNVVEKLSISEKREFVLLEDLCNINKSVFSNNPNNSKRKAFLKKAVEWYIKERLCIELDSVMQPKPHTS